jgi:hypothetical protein
MRYKLLTKNLEIPIGSGYTNIIIDTLIELLFTTMT